MAPRTKEQFEKIREERRHQIMDVALDLYSREGFGHVSIAQLAKAAGISKGLMYNYFESKEQLLIELVEGGVNHITRLFDPNHDGELTPEEFEFFIRKTFQMLRENPKYWGMFFGLIIQPNVATQMKNSPMVRFIEEYMTILLKYLEKKGFEDPMLELLHLSAIIEGLAVLMIYSDNYLKLPQDTLDKFENRIITMYK